MLRLVALQPGRTLTMILGNKTVHIVQLTILAEMWIGIHPTRVDMPLTI